MIPAPSIPTEHPTDARNPPSQEPSLVTSATQDSHQNALIALTIERAIHTYLQDQRENGRSSKTLEWHQTALGQFQQYLMNKRHLCFLSQITENEVRCWLIHLGKTEKARGNCRSVTTITTYARSARAFCHWLVRHGYLEQTPWAKVSLPKEEKKPLLRLIELQEWERLLLACRPAGHPGSLGERPTARNRAILWVLLDTGIRVAELCELRITDVDREQGSLLVRGKGTKERRVALSPKGLSSLLSYLDQYRPKRGLAEGGRGGEDHLFLTETYQPLTKNSLTLLFGRLKERAGISGKRISPSLLRDTFAVRYLQAGGDPATLLELLGLQDRSMITRYQSRSHHRVEKEKPGDHRMQHGHLF